MKRFLFFCGIAALLSGCGGSKNAAPMIPMGSEVPQATTETVAEETVSSPTEPAVIENRVKAIYESVALAYPDVPDLTPSNDSLDLAYCSMEWQTLVEMINAKDADDASSEKFFDSDYWIMGQDYQNISATDIKAEVKDNTHADATLNLHNCGKTTKVRLEMVFERGEWFIANFIDEKNHIDWKQKMLKHLETKKEEPKKTDIIEYE